MAVAFMREQTWRVAEVRAGAGAAVPLLPQAWALRVRAGGSILLSGLVHLALLWLLLTRLGPGDVAAPDRPEGPPSRLLSFDMGSATVAPAAAPAAAVPPAPAAPAEIDLSRASQLPPPEWSVATIAAPPQAAPAAPAPAASAGAAAGTGAGGGVYDPFAGAAPQRLRHGAEGLDAALLEALRTAVSQAHPGAGGSVELTVRLSPAGAVLEARLRGGTAPAAAREAMRRILLGKRLFPAASGTAGTVDLPSFSLGI